MHIAPANTLIHVSTKIFISMITGFSMKLSKFIILIRLREDAFMELREDEALRNCRCLRL